jgi:hypothetical protein
MNELESGLYPEQSGKGPSAVYTSKTKRGECKVKDCKEKRANGSCRCLKHKLKI